MHNGKCLYTFVVGYFHFSCFFLPQVSPFQTKWKFQLNFQRISPLFPYNPYDTVCVTQHTQQSVYFVDVVKDTWMEKARLQPSCAWNTFNGHCAYLCVQNVRVIAKVNFPWKSETWFVDVDAIRHCVNQYGPQCGRIEILRLVVV